MVGKGDLFVLCANLNYPKSLPFIFGSMGCYMYAPSVVETSCFFHAVNSGVFMLLSLKYPYPPPLSYTLPCSMLSCYLDGSLSATSPVRPSRIIPYGMKVCHANG